MVLVFLFTRDNALEVHAAANGKVSSFLWLSTIPLHVCADGHLGCFHILTIINNPSGNTGVRISLQTSGGFLDKYPEVE